jgi:hypothetical protein
MKKEDIDRKIRFLMTQCGHVTREQYERWKIESSKPGYVFPALETEK